MNLIKQDSKITKKDIFYIENTFKCDSCAEIKNRSEMCLVYNENYVLQKGIFECFDCKINK